MEASLYGEGTLSVDSVFLARTEIIINSIPEYVDTASATSIAARKDTRRARSVTCMSNSSVCKSISFHDIELGAPVATNLVCIAVFERVTNIVYSRHEHCVKSSDAATTCLTQINIILDLATKQVCSKVLRSVKILSSREVHSIVELEANLISGSRGT